MHFSQWRPKTAHLVERLRAMCNRCLTAEGRLLQKMLQAPLLLKLRSYGRAMLGNLVVRGHAHVSIWYRYVTDSRFI